MTPQVLEKLKSIATKYDDLTRLLSDPSVQADPPVYRTHAKALSDMQETIDTFRQFQTVEQSLREHRELAAGSDAELQALALEEIPALEAQVAELEDQLRVLLVPKDPNDDRNVVLE